ncbi:MAG TPA: hypothetical protein VHB79_26465 [Polyangiaceae bacterium]|nr:hypothetical protein [Polyangiaceae bacterium]
MATVAVEERPEADLRSDGLLVAIPVAALCLLCIRYARLYGGNVVDDAMTSMQYAKQLSQGHGLVFNVGERVEGYTNFAWVMFMTPLYWLSERCGFPFVGAVTACNVLFAATNMLLVLALARRLLGERHLAAWLAAGLCLVDNSYAVWAVLGLEVHFLALFMLLALWASSSEHPRRNVWLGAALLGAHLTRPDAGLFCAVLLGNRAVEAVVRRKSGRAAQELRGIALAGAIWVVGYGCYFYWRYRYYGLPFPNTYYLKLGGPIDAWARGFDYLRSFLYERAFVPVLALTAVLAVQQPLVRGLLLYNVLHVLYVVYVGGDFFAGHRFFVPELPQLALLCAVGVAEVWKRAQSPRARAWLSRARATPERLQGALVVAHLVLLGAVFQRGLALGPLAGEVLTWGQDLSRQTRLFRWLGEHKPAGASIATCLIGHTGFYSSARVIDMCGVIDPVTASRHVANFGKGKAGHEKLASSEETLAKHPTFIADYVIAGDLWQRGYFLRADIPDDTYEGIWQRDPLLSTGQFLPDTRVSFDFGPPAGWSATGSAFEHWPSQSRWSGQGELIGSSGSFVNTFHPSLGTAATGTLTSAPFELRGDLLLFRLGGGKDATNLRVELLVDGAVTHSATGRRGDQLSRREWDIAPLRGKQAVLRVVDNTSDAWGYLALDEIVQWKR